MLRFGALFSTNTMAVGLQIFVVFHVHAAYCRRYVGNTDTEEAISGSSADPLAALETFAREHAAGEPPSAVYPLPSS